MNKVMTKSHVYSHKEERTEEDQNRKVFYEKQQVRISLKISARLNFKKLSIVTLTHILEIYIDFLNTITSPTSTKKGTKISK